MAKTQFLDYTIYLTDAAHVAELQAAPHAGGAVGRTIIPPTEAATTYSAPIQEENEPAVSPGIRSEWFTSGNNFPRNERTFERCTGGWFGICFLFGERTKFYWRGQFKWVPAVDAVTPPVGVAKVAMAKRRFVDGAEFTGLGEGGSGNEGNHIARGASRHLQGFGYVFDQSTNVREHTPVEAGGAATNQQWERLYFRIRQFPGAESRLWRSSCTAGAAAGAELALLPSGQIAINGINNVGAKTLIGVLPAIKLHRFYKWDILFRHNTAPLVGGYFGLYQNGVLLADLNAGAWGTLGFGMALQGNIASSSIGNPNANTCVWECDDWIGAELPTGTAGTPAFVGTFPGLDWNNGSRVAFIGADAFGSDNAASWAAAGSYLFTRQRLAQTGVAPPHLENATGSARLTVRTDAVREIDNQLGQLGLAAMTIGSFSLDTGAIGAQLGYRIHTLDAAVLVAVTQGNANYEWRQAYYFPSMIDPISPATEIELILERGAGAGTMKVQVLAASAEIVGVFGPEDLVPGAVNQVGTETPAPTINVATQTAGYVADIIAQNTAAGISMSGDCGAFEITKRVAWGLRHEGAGLQYKPAGANCGERAVAIIMFPDGGAFDILTDAGNTNGATWSAIVDLDPDLYRAPVDPGDAGTLSAGPPEHIGIHNAPYPHTPWSRRGTPPFSPVVLHTGTYVGTGTFIDLPFRAPVHFLAVRPLTGSSGGFVWWSSQNSGHFAGARGQTTFAPLDVLIDPAFVGAGGEDDQEQQTIVRIVGGEADSNAVGVVYQFTAFSDPAHRFALAGATNVRSGATSIVTVLDDEAYTPQAVFVQQELFGNTATVGLHYKGPGHGAGNISPANAAEIAGLGYARGTVTSQNALHSASLDQIAFIAFRDDDGSGDDGIPQVVAITSYTGDGAASRSIGIPMNGCRPVFAWIAPHNGAAVYRDASHTGTTSTTFPATANAATGITGGAPDSISVGSALNANGIGYDVFVFPGDTVAGNGGWSINGEFVPVSPDSPGGGDVSGGLWDATPPDPELSPDEPDGEGEEPTDPTGPTLPDGQTGADFATTCVAQTTFIINQALSRIGVSKQIGNIVTEQSKEATTSRLHYIRDVETTLRRFPWPFATRYARLVLVAGTSSAPVNGDWQYSYREPADSLFSRRIVNPSLVGRGWDPYPPKFRIGGDNTGRLIYTNEAPTSGQPGSLAPELEYTIRTTCAASQGDEMFREALIWQHAASLAPSLAKDGASGAIAKFCLAMFERRIVEAEVAASNEKQDDPDGDAPWISGRDQ